MSDIPEDVMVLAQEAFDTLPLGYEKGAVEIIARAILAERERCAKAICSGCGEGITVNGRGYHERASGSTLPCHAEAIFSPKPFHPKP